MKTEDKCAVNAERVTHESKGTATQIELHCKENKHYFTQESGSTEQAGLKMYVTFYAPYALLL